MIDRRKRAYGYEANDCTSRGRLPVRAHLDTQVALQPFVDNSISKTINVPEACPFDEFSRIYDLAYDLQLKGCTTLPPQPHNKNRPERAGRRGRGPSLLRAGTGGRQRSNESDTRDKQL